MRSVPSSLKIIIVVYTCELEVFENIMTDYFSNKYKEGHDRYKSKLPFVSCFLF